MDSEETEDEALQSWHGVLHRAAVTHGLARAGAIKLGREIRDIRATHPETAGQRSFVGVGNPNAPDSIVYGGVAGDDIPEMLSEGGAVLLDLGRQWLVYVYSAWDATHRARIAKAKGLADARDLVEPIMGDLRLIRHDILHNRAVATNEHCGRCEVIAHWVPLGQDIVITTDHVIEFMRHWELASTMIQGPPPGT